MLCKHRSGEDPTQTVPKDKAGRRYWERSSIIWLCKWKNFRGTQGSVPKNTLGTPGIAKSWINISWVLQRRSLLPRSVLFSNRKPEGRTLCLSDLGRVPNAPKNPLLHSQATLSNADKNFNLCFCQVLIQSRVKGGASAGALAPHWQLYENELFLSLLVISHVSHGVPWYRLSPSFCSAVWIQTQSVGFFCSAHISYTEYFKESFFLTNPCDEMTQCSIFVIIRNQWRQMQKICSPHFQGNQRASALSVF